MSEKSTILGMVTDRRVPSTHESFPPTIDYSRKGLSVNNVQITFFDLSGRSGFLDRFTGELSESIFSGVLSLVYVVDSIKMKDIYRTKYYLDRCVEKIDQYSPEAAVVIFQHKYDLVPKKVTAGSLSIH